MKRLLEREIDLNKFELFRVMGEIAGTPVKDHGCFLETRLNPSPLDNCLYRFDIEEAHISDIIERIKEEIRITNGLMGFILHATDQGLSLFKRLGFTESSVIHHLFLNL